MHSCPCGRLLVGNPDPGPSGVTEPPQNQSPVPSPALTPLPSPSAAASVRFARWAQSHAACRSEDGHNGRQTRARTCSKPSSLRSWAVAPPDTSEDVTSHLGPLHGGSSPRAMRLRPTSHLREPPVSSHPGLATLTLESSGRPPPHPNLQQPQPYASSTRAPTPPSHGGHNEWGRGWEGLFPSLSSLPSLPPRIHGHHIGRTRAAEGRWLSRSTLSVVTPSVTSPWTLRAAQPSPYPHLVL